MIDSIEDVLRICDMMNRGLRPDCTVKEEKAIRNILIEIYGKTARFPLKDLMTKIHIYFLTHDFDSIFPYEEELYHVGRYVVDYGKLRRLQSPYCPLVSGLDELEYRRYKYYYLLSNTGILYDMKNKEQVEMKYHSFTNEPVYIFYDDSKERYTSKLVSDMLHETFPEIW